MMTGVRTRTSYVITFQAIKIKGVETQKENRGHENGSEGQYKQAIDDNNHNEDFSRKVLLNPIIIS
jgi:hypothetical protein